MKVLIGCVLLLYIHGIVAPPVNEKKKDKEHAENNEIESQAFDVEYKRYLQEVVDILENDDEFKKRLNGADPEDIKSGKIARELEFVNHNVRTKLDELKRQELDRLRKAAIQQYEYSNGIDKKHLKIPGHIDPKNPHTFEAEDLRKLIVHTAKELEDVDRQRKEEFKEYEMRKELEYQEQLKHMDDKNREAARKQHEEKQQKHKEHKPLHHPGSKQQFEEVWEEQDHLSPEDFNPKTFFHLHDLDGNGVWDANEVKALFKKELDKMYDPNAPEDDIRERFEEMERMREHVFNESDTNRDQLISYDEFLAQTKKQEFERDEGWKGIDEQAPYTNEEYQQYAQQHENEIRRMIDQGLIPPAPPGYVPLVIPPGQHPPPGLQGHPQQPIYHVPPPQGGVPPHSQGQQQMHYQQQPAYQQQPQGAYQYNPNDPSHHQQAQYQQPQYAPQHPQGQQQYQVPAQQQYHPQQVPAQQQQYHQQQVPAGQPHYQQQQHPQQVPAQQYQPQQNQQAQVQPPVPQAQVPQHPPQGQQYQAAPPVQQQNSINAPPADHNAVPSSNNQQPHAPEASSTNANAVPAAPNSNSQPSH